MFYFIVKSLRSRWFEYLLGALLIAPAGAVITSQRSLSASVEGKIHDLAHRLGKNMLVVPAKTDLSRFYELEFDGVSTRILGRVDHTLRGLNVSIMIHTDLRDDKTGLVFPY